MKLIFCSTYKLYHILLLLFFISATHLFAGTTGKIAGNITDGGTGEALAGVNVYLQNLSLGAATDMDGNYVIIGIPPGTYTLIINFISYGEKQLQNVHISIDKTTRINESLNPITLESTEEIIVYAKRPLIKKDLTSTEASIDAEMISILPVDNLSDIINLQAGVVDGHFRGGRTGEVLYMVNGIPINDVYSGSNAIEIENDAVQEVNIISGTFNAEYGQAMSGVVNVVTKEGGSDMSYNLSTYTGTYLTTNDNIFWNDEISSVHNFQGSIDGPLNLWENKFNFFISGRYNSDGGYIFGKDVFEPSDVNPDFLLVDIPEERTIVSHGTEFAFSEQKAKEVIDNAQTVSMNKRERISGNFKLTYQATVNDKINFETLYQDEKWNEYHHEFRLNPTGDYKYFQTSNNNSISWKHVFGPTTFFDSHISYFKSEFNQYVHKSRFDEQYVVKERLTDSGASAFKSGGQQMWNFARSTETALLKLDLTSQINFYNQLKVGIEGKKHNLFMHEFEVIPELEEKIAPLTSYQNNTYSHYPIDISVYAQDKFEHQDLVVNVGLRFDYFDPDATTIISTENPSESEQIKAKISTQISPRFGIAYPISETGVIHVSYGHFFQVPNYLYMYTNPEFDIDPLQSSASEPPQSVRNTIGNANLKPQKTVIYEMGLQQSVGNLYSINLTVYFKDYRNLLGTEVLYTTEGFRYGRYINRDYGFTRGVTLALEKRYMDSFSFNIDYTFQVAKGNASDPNNAFLDSQADKETAKQVVPLDWDRTHQINTSVRFGSPEDIMVSMIGRYGTGTPFTQASRTVQPLVENGGRKPNEYSVDIYTTKRLEFAGVNLTLFLKVFNLFDTLNERDVFSDTGRANYSTEPLYFGGERPRGLNTLEDYYIRPEYYSSPRKIQLGLEVSL
jgi:outer membrane receptor protein involved in Fe transport